VKDPRTRITEVVGGRGTLATRLETVNAALAQIAENPIVGSGFDRESTDVFAGRQVHSMPILAWQGGGLLVLVGLFGVIWLSLRVVRPGKRPFSRRIRAIRAALLGATCAMVINGLAQPFLYKRFGWIPVALIFSRPILARAPRRATARHLEAHEPSTDPIPMAGAHP
jgi:O-antigen ligase